MRQLVYFVAVSVDGRIAGPHDDFSAFPTTGDHIEWIAREYPATLPGPALAALGITADRSRFSTVVMGWNTYAIGVRAGVPDPYPHLEQVVFTRQHASVEKPATVRFVADDPVREIERLRGQEGSDIWLCGGGDLAATLADEIDRLVLKVNPLVLGDGVPLFRSGYQPRHLRLVRSTPFQSGVVVNEYSTGRAATGSSAA